MPAPPPKPGVAHIRCDGVYQSDEEQDPVPFRRYLRFFADGSVAHASVSRATPEDVVVWLGKRDDGDEARAERLMIDGARVTFTTISEHGNIDFDCTFDGERILAQLTSHATGARFEQEFHFMPVNGR